MTSLDGCTPGELQSTRTSPTPRYCKIDAKQCVELDGRSSRTHVVAQVEYAKIRTTRDVSIVVIIVDAKMT